MIHLLRRLAEQQAGGFLPHPNASNPNPELIVNDAISFTSEVNSITGIHTPLGAEVTSVSDATNGYGSWVGHARATSDGTLKRDRIALGTLTSGEIYEVYILERHNDTTDNARFRIAAGSSDGDHQVIHTAHTDWQLHNFEFTSDGTAASLHHFVRQTSVTNQWVEYKVSVKLKND